MNATTRNILSLDAAFGPACACIRRADGARFHAETPANRPHSQGILPMLETLLGEAGLDWRDLHLLAAGIGPGSFTGVRMAAAIIAGVNASLKRPVLPLSSLAVTAWRAGNREEIHVIEDARADLYWTGRYRGSKALEPDRAIERARLANMGPGRMVSETMTGNELPGWEVLPLIRSRAEALGMLADHAAERMEQSDTLPEFVAPAYLCLSQAERNATHG